MSLFSGLQPCVFGHNFFTIFSLFLLRNWYRNHDNVINLFLLLDVWGRVGTYPAREISHQQFIPSVVLKLGQDAGSGHNKKKNHPQISPSGAAGSRASRRRNPNGSCLVMPILIWMPPFNGRTWTIRSNFEANEEGGKMGNSLYACAHFLKGHNARKSSVLTRVA